LQADRDAVVTCTDLVRTYRTATGQVPALRGVTASFPRGSVTAVIGPSGSGKSSLLRLIAGLDHLTDGSLTVDGVEADGTGSRGRRRIRRRSVGYVFQQPSDNYLPHLTLGEHLRMAAGRGRPADPLLALLDTLAVADRSDHRPDALSGGEQQRGAFAEALATGAPLVVADEPTAELDEASAALVLERIRALADGGVSFVIATHDPAVIAVADERLVLDHGVVREAGAEGPTAIPPYDVVPEVRWPQPQDPSWFGDEPEPVVTVSGVSKTYGEGENAVRALVDVDLQAVAGEIVMVVGRSGSGKTTLLHSLAGWERPDAGALETPGGAHPDWSAVAVVPQRLGLMDELSVEENVGYPARVAGETEARRDLVDDLIRRLGLERLRRRYPKETSLGEQQRTALARALVLQPRLLIADELTGHQDAGWVEQVAGTLNEVAAMGTCCVVATHDEGLVRYADRAMSMAGGRLSPATNGPAR
jgi:putative ABC transport system ATP-binding protein